MAALRAELAELKAGKATAEIELRDTRSRLRTSELSTMSAQERAIVSDQEATDARLEALESEATALEDQIATLADEPGNGREIAKLTRQIAQITTKIDGETNKKTYLAGQREKVTATNKTAREAAPAEGAKKLANGLVYDTLSSQTKAWADAHPEVFTDLRFAKKATLAAQEAIDVEGLKDNSPEYFAFIEDRLGIKAAPDQDDDEEEGEDVLSEPARESYTPEKPQRAAAGPGAMAGAAPPTRQTPQGGNGGNNRRMPTLTSDEREVALSLYPHLKTDADKLVAYAKGKQFMKDRDNKHFRGNN